jgi:hypothetical protein
MRERMSGIWKHLIVGIEDLLGIMALGFALVAAITTWLPPPEAGSASSSALGLVLAFLFVTASVLFLMAARHLQKTGRFSPVLHLAPIVCVLAMPLAGALIAHP